MNLKSKTIHFRPAGVSDARFIHALRIDPQFNQHLSVVDDDLAKQEQWMAEYEKRAAQGLEYYYIIQRNADLLPIGTVRLYDFLPDVKSFCWGSWILNGDKTRYSAIESALLIYDFAFFELGFQRCHMDIRKQNLKVFEFHQRMGVKIIGETPDDLLGHYFVDDYLKVRDGLNKVIEASGSI